MIDWRVNKFQRCRKGDLSGRCRVDSPVDLFEPVILFNADKAQVFKVGSKITSAVAAGVFVKCYFYKNLFSRFRHLFRLSRPKRCIACAMLAHKAGVHTPVPWGYLRESGLIMPVRDYLVTDLLSSDTTFMPELICKAPEEAVTKIITSIVKLHNSGIEHGDLSMRNLYLAPDGNAGVIDLDGSKIHRKPLSMQVRIREMARLISSAAQVNSRIPLEKFKEMFLAAYHKSCGIDLASEVLELRINYLYNRRRA
ncbi:MAG: hypothetical protein IKA87_09915 [Lentisphaeria bacterium]|nr:hypothetical protein [Lentisphaeria bacterium]